MKKRLFGMIMALMLCMLLLPVTAMAASDPESYVFDISKGRIIITDGGTAGTVKVTYGSNSVDNIDPSQVITVTGEYTGTATWESDNNLLVQTLIPVTIKASGLRIDNAGSAYCYAMALEAESANVTLILDGENYFAGGQDKGGIVVGTGRTLTIEGSGSVTAKGGTNYGGAGIGGDGGGDCGTIIINSGDVTAIGGIGASSIGAGGGSGNRNHGTLSGSGGAWITAETVRGDMTDFNGVLNGNVYGNAVLKKDRTIPEGDSLTVTEGATLTIPEGVTLTVDGTIINNGTIVGKVTGNQPKASVMYLDENGSEKTADCTVLTADNIENYRTLNAGWYVVRDAVEILYVTVNGDVHLILEDGSDFNVNFGIRLKDDDNDVNNGSANALSIYAQSTGKNMGKLTAGTGTSSEAAIGGGYAGNGGVLTINGGTVTATASNGAGIGGGGGGETVIGGYGGTITINGGIVTATSETGAGIGGGGSEGGVGGSGGIITITGGTVTATSNVGAGIGVGEDGSGGTFRTDDGNAVIFATSISDKTNQNSWSGVIFDGSEGKVYGASVTPDEDFTIDSGKNLLIPENAELIIEDITAVNEGRVYVDGTVSGLGGDLYYPLTVSGAAAGGDVSTYLNKDYGKAGGTVTLKVAPPKGYTVKTVTVTKGNNGAVSVKNTGKNEYAFTMPASKVTAKAVCAEIENPFTDVKSGDYYYDAVLWAVDNGITNGTSATTFSPDLACTRGQVVTFLWRAAGCPAPKGASMSFTDVKSGDYYYDAVLWAVENGITNGTSATTFSPDMICTRAQIVTLLWRSQGMPAAGMSNPFADVKSGDYYYDAVLWAVKEGITYGTSDTTFSPDLDCTRGQTVTFLYRCMGE
ncbi:MAG: S-layer homology domain-containing protein [Clostridia bacterium]